MNSARGNAGAVMLDERLVGVWVHETQINSPGGRAGSLRYRR